MIGRLLLTLLSIIAIGNASLAQCNCPDSDSTSIGGFVRSADCADLWFKKYYGQAQEEKNDRKRRRYLKKAFLLKPNYPGLLEQYVVEGDHKDLRQLRDVLRCMLKNHDLLNSEIVTYNLALAYAQYRLGAYGDGYQEMSSGISRDVFCRIPHQSRKALICNNLSVLQLHYQGTNNMYRKPVKPLSSHDIGTSIGMLDSALSLAPGDTVIRNNRDKMPDIRRTPFNKYLCNRKPIRQDNDSLAALHRRDSIRTAKYCTTSLFDVHYDSLYDHMRQFDEIVFLHDVSGSMDTITANSRGIRRIEMANQLLQCLTYDLAHKDLGLVSVGNLCGTVPRHLYPVTQYDTVRFRSEMSCCDVFGETPLRERLERIDTLYVRPESRKLAFLLTDGMDNCTSPFDLCEISKQLFDKGIYLSILHLLPDAPEYKEITDIYHCMTSASRSHVFKMTEQGTIQLDPPNVATMPYLNIPEIELCDSLDSEGRTACRCRAGIVGCIKPESERWKKGNTWGKGATDPVKKVNCRIPRYPWQCKWLKRPPRGAVLPSL